MQENLNTKKSFGIGFNNIFILFLIITLFVSVFFKETIFEIVAPEATEISETKKTSQEIANALLLLDKINFDTSVLRSEYFAGIALLPTYPTDSRTLSNFGKANPFLGGFSIVPAKATTSVGAIIYSSQRSINDGRAIVPVTNNRPTTSTGQGRVDR